MKVGLILPHLGPETTKESVEKIAVGAENEGFDSLWVLERLLWPLNPQTPYPATEDGTLPTFYQEVLDPLETLAFVAGKTERIALGTSVIDMLFHNPVVLAKRFVTLDLLSNGRAICGLGIGWSKDEYQASNIPQLVTDSAPSSNRDNGDQSRIPLSRTIDQIGQDIKALKVLGFEQIVFAFSGLELDKVIGTAKELSQYAQ